MKLLEEKTTREEVKPLVDAIVATLHEHEATQIASIASLLSVTLLILDPHITPERIQQGIRETSQFMTLFLHGFSENKPKPVVH